MLALVCGQKIKLNDITTSSSLKIRLVANMSTDATVDMACFAVDSQERLSDDRYFIFYNQTHSPCGSIKSLSAGGDAQEFRIELLTLPMSIRKLVFVLTIDGKGKMSDLINGSIGIFDESFEFARYSFTGSDFKDEKAIIVGELYIKDVWRFSAVGQGFQGGLSALLKHFGGEEAPSLQSKSTTKKVSLEKKLEKDAPHLVHLAKTLTVSLEKKSLQDTVAKVALVLDASGSMFNQYSNGDLQLVVDKIVPLAVHFDDDGELETWVFAEKQKSLTPVTVKNVKGYVDNQWGGWNNWMDKLNAGINNEPVVMKEILNAYKDSHLPAYVIFISDGGVGYSDQIEKILVKASKCPIFWQFVGLGGSNYGILEHFDTMQGRFIDNCNFFALDDIHSITDSELYERLLNEFPSWLKLAKKASIL